MRRQELSSSAARCSPKSRKTADRRCCCRASAQHGRTQLMPAAGPELQRKLQLANNPQQVVASDLTEAKLYRAIYGTHQLEEQLTDFWFNHFNVSLDKGRIGLTGHHL